MNQGLNNRTVCFLAEISLIHLEERRSSSCSNDSRRNTLGQRNCLRLMSIRRQQQMHGDIFDHP
jgi:hypothetical protein